MCKLRATHRSLITCNMHGHVARREGSAIQLDKDKIDFILALFHWLQSLADKGEAEGVVGSGGGGVGGGGSIPAITCFRKCHSPKPDNSSSNRDSYPHFSIGARRLLGKQTCSPLYHAWLHTLRIVFRLSANELSCSK